MLLENVVKTRPLVHKRPQDTQKCLFICSQKQTDMRLHYGFLYWLSQLQMNNLDGLVVVVLCRNTAGHGMPNLFRTVNHNLYK